MPNGSADTAATAPASADERRADNLATRGDTRGALELLERCVATDTNRPELWLKLAAIRRARGDLAGSTDAISAGLAIDPLHFMLLMSRARLLEAQGDVDEAARGYLRALAQLPAGETPPPELRGLIEHATKIADQYRDKVAARWEEVLDAVPRLDTIERARATRFTSNALRRTRVYHSEPTHFHYPGLIEREFHDRRSFPWLTAVEAATDAIRDEYLGLVQRGDARAEPYVQYSAGLPLRQWAVLNHSLNWTAFHLLRNGERVEANAAACPATLTAVRQVDQPQVAGRSPNAMFSLLKPRTSIPPHTGVANTRLVCHLPLIVPDGCWFRVGAERRQWRVGEAFVFDDTIEHEAANDSDLPRVVLIFDVWHSGLAPAERAAVKALMETDSGGDGAPL